MNKLLAITTAAGLLLAILIWGVPWYAGKLPNGYKYTSLGGFRGTIQRPINCPDVNRARTCWKNVVPDGVVDYTTKGDFIIALRVKIDSYECGKGESREIVTRYSKKREYWVINWRTGTIYGALTSQQFSLLASRLGIQQPSLEVPKNYKDNEDYFGQSMLGNCIPLIP